VAEETIRNSISASTRDPRFPPLTLEELEGVTLSVDILSALEPAPSEPSWDVGRYGVLVDQGPRRGVLLPAVEGVSTAEEQIEIACRKAGIDPHSSFRVSLFQVERHQEQEGG
jgi:AMMECR1 domain-containing protein